MSLHLLRTCVILAATCCVISRANLRGFLVPWNEITTHPELSNREQWLDHLSKNPIGRLFNLYQGLGKAGIDFRLFDLQERPLVLNDVDPLPIRTKDGRILQKPRELDESDFDFQTGTPTY